ncbi:hypothetical protein BZA05DRAFT_122457 [Tricharina praecox]|uniref:uncharacterized protein n=1 Tax=Tricharina praecox TaxID=43433 RepID=UPI00221FAA8A|nr:uncharacterized protein BZA05DRAFT_122457 [Tricharina praecox]KAI5848207.1 hypothetical protein BZA05DRAFT_122457 [Tricharina praecox]
MPVQKKVSRETLLVGRSVARSVGHCQVGCHPFQILDIQTSRHPDSKYPEPPSSSPSTASSFSRALEIGNVTETAPSSPSPPVTTSDHDQSSSPPRLSLPRPFSGQYPAGGMQHHHHHRQDTTRHDRPVSAAPSLRRSAPAPRHDAMQELAAHG